MEVLKSWKVLLVLIISNRSETLGFVIAPYMSSHCFRHSAQEIATSQSHEPLRGCSLSSLIWDASLLRNSEDCVAAYNASAPVRSVDIFLSHAWSDSGWWKQLALLVCCSSAMPYKVTVISSIVGAWLCGYTSCKGYYLILVLLGLFSFIGSTISLSLFKHRNTIVFLDKCCINQSDFAAKMRGISRLSDYLRVSNKLIVLWTPTYLDRLWCVYELAVFMQTHDKKDVIILNLRHVKLCLYLMMIQLMDIVSIYAIRECGGTDSCCKMVLSVATSVLLGREAFGCFQDWSTFSSKLSSFSVSDAKCTSPADYTKLKDLITELYGSENQFAARVRGLCLGSADEEPAPLWLLSRDSLRICSVPYIPVAVGAIRLLIDNLVGSKTPQMQICPSADACVTPSLAAELLWSLRTNVFQIFIQSFRVPCMIILGHKLSFRVCSKQPNSLHLLTVCYCISFVLYTCFTQALCGLHVLYDHPLVGAPIRSTFSELLLVLIGVISVCVLFMGLRRFYSHDVSNIILHRGRRGALEKAE